MERLAEEYPGSARDLCELRFTTPFELLVATVLSAQTTDVRVNEVTPALFARYPTPGQLGAANPEELEGIIHSTGFFRAKARSLIALGQGLDERFAGQVPVALDDLVTLAGVARKTANVVRSVAFGEPGFPVDTHVTRLTKLLGLTDLAGVDQDNPVKIEAAITAMVPRAEWGPLSLRLILHGRRVCIARRPRCGECVLADFCPSVQWPTAAPPSVPPPTRSVTRERP